MSGRWTRRPRWAGALLLVAAALAGGAACAGPAQAPEGGVIASFDEGSISLTVDLLDVGLLKGNVTAQAKGDWRVVELSVAAADHRGTPWNVLQFPEGVGSERATAFYEVLLQELPRHQQLTISARGTFEDEGGARVEREATDRWPP